MREIRQRAKAIINEYIKLTTIILPNFERAIAEVEEELTSLKSIQLSDMPKGSSIVNYRIENLIINKDKLKNAYNKQLLINERFKRVFYSLEPIEREAVLFKMNNVSIQSLLQKYKVSKTEFYRIKDRAYKKILEKY